MNSVVFFSGSLVLGNIIVEVTSRPPSCSLSNTRPHTYTTHFHMTLPIPLSVIAVCIVFFTACENYQEMGATELYALAQEAVEKGKFEKAERLSRVASKKGEVRAQVLLGNILYDSDREAAFRHWKAAAEKGEPSAKYNLGFFAYTDKNDEEALFWISDAASQGYEEAQYLYGIMYKEGRGVEMDFEKARYWLQQAAGNNHQYAIEQLKNFSDQGKINSSSF